MDPEQKELVERLRAIRCDDDLALSPPNTNIEKLTEDAADLIETLFNSPFANLTPQEVGYLSKRLAELRGPGFAPPLSSADIGKRYFLTDGRIVAVAGIETPDENRFLAVIDGVRNGFMPQSILLNSREYLGK